jgi:hypothetical protein
VLSIAVGTDETAGLLGWHAGAKTDLISGIIMTAILVLMFGGVCLKDALALKWD